MSEMSIKEPRKSILEQLKGIWQQFNEARMARKEIRNAARIEAAETRKLESIAEQMTAFIEDKAKENDVGTTVGTNLGESIIDGEEGSITYKDGSMETLREELKIESRDNSFRARTRIGNNGGGSSAGKGTPGQEMSREERA